MRRFDLVVLDLDGTLINPYKREAISPAVLETIARVQTAGIMVTIGTGRSLDYVRQHLPEELHLELPVMTTQGAIIGDPRTGVVLIEQDIPLGQAQRLAAWLDTTGYPTAFYFNQNGRSRIHLNRDGRTEEERDLYRHLLGFPVQMCDRLADLVEGDAATPPIKVMTLNDPARQPDLLPEYLRQFTPALSVTRTHPWLIEATAAGIDKGTGLWRLCELLKVTPDRVLAIGDSDNDIPMLAAAGFGIAMGNASPGMLAVAHWVAPPIEEDGAAVALRKWVLEND